MREENGDGNTSVLSPKLPGLRAADTPTSWMDGPGRVEIRTDAWPLESVPGGEIVTVEQQGNRAFTGICAAWKMCLQIPFFYRYGLAHYLPIVRKLVGKHRRRGNGDTHEI